MLYNIQNITEMEENRNRILTPELLKDLADYPLYSQEDKHIPDLVAVAKMCIGSMRWYIIEGNAEGGRFTFYNLVCGLDEMPELGYTDADELASVSVDCARYGFPGTVLRVEREEDFIPCRLADIDDEEVKSFCNRFVEE